jgi:hypothetical protein
MPDSDRELERFIGEHFDSEEAVMIVLALRLRGAPLPVTEILQEMEQTFGAVIAVDRLIAAKRIELRLRDLTANGLAEHLEDGAFRYRGEEAGLEPDVARVALAFDARRAWLNRVIYSAASRARRLAEAFRL